MLTVLFYTLNDLEKKKIKTINFECFFSSAMMCRSVQYYLDWDRFQPPPFGESS